jgi:hypothetical protein
MQVPITPQADVIYLLCSFNPLNISLFVMVTFFSIKYSPPSYNIFSGSFRSSRHPIFNERENNKNKKGLVIFVLYHV